MQWEQVCQISRGTTYKNWKNIPKRQQNIPNGHKIYQYLALKGTPKFTQIVKLQAYVSLQLVAPAPK
jgi:hypothetical protein